MAEQFGIRLSVSADDLVVSINEAIKKINGSDRLNKIKLGIDASSFDEAVKRIKSEIADITGKVGASKIDIGFSDNEKSMNAAVQKQDKQLNALVTGYMKQFDVVRRTADETASEIRAKFAEAISNVFSSKNSGDEFAVKDAFSKLEALTVEYARTYKNTVAINEWEDFKSSLGGVIPISEDVRAELKYLCGDISEVKKTLNGAFGSDGWKFTNTAKGGTGTDQFFQGLGIPGFEESEHVTNGLLKLIETGTRLNNEAKKWVSQYDLGFDPMPKMTEFLNNAGILNDVREKEAETAKNTALAEKQAAASLQSAADVTEKFKVAMTPILEENAGNYVSEMMAAIEPYKNAVDALGRALDRLSSAKSFDMTDEMRSMNDAFSAFREGITDPDGLINELNAFAAAEEKNISIINDEKSALSKLTAEAEKYKNAKKQSSKSENASNVGLGVNVNSLIKSINAAVRDINKNSADVMTKIKISADAVRLRSSIRKAVNEINKDKSLDSSPVKLNVAFKNVRKAVLELQKQVDGTSVKVGTVAVNGVVAGSSDITSNAVRQAAEEATAALNRQAQAEKDAANAAVDDFNAAINAENSERRAVGELSDALDELLRKKEALGRQSKEQENFAADDTPISKIEKYGSGTSNTTYRYRYDPEMDQYNLSSYSTEYNASAKKADLDKLYVAAIQLESKLKDVDAAYTDINLPKAIKGQEHLTELKQKYDDIIKSIIEMTKTSGESTNVIKANISAQIDEFERTAISFKNSEYVGNKLRDRTVGVISVEELENLRAFNVGITDTRTRTPEVINEINALSEALRRIATDENASKEELIEVLNRFDILKSNVKASNAELQASDKTMKELQKTMSSLNGISNNVSLHKIKGNEKVQAVYAEVERLKASYQDLIDKLRQDGSVDNLINIREQMAVLETQTVDLIREADGLAKSFRNIRVDENNIKRLEQLEARAIALKNANTKGLNVTNPNTGMTFGAEIDNIIKKIPEARVMGEDLTKTLESGLKSVELQMKALGVTGKTFWQEMKEKASKFFKWTMMTLVVTKIRMYFNKLFTTVYELDTELIDLKKTFKGTTAELDNFYFEANRLAKQMGVTTAEIIKQGAAWSRLGYSSNETMKKMAEMSAMFAAISPDMGVEEAQNGLVSIMKAFDIDPDNVLDGILSKVNIIGNTAATSNGEIVEMLQKSSSAMKEANNTLEETIALETAAVEITRDSASVGTAYKTISARLRGLDEETLEVIEDTEILTGKFAEATKTINNPGGLSLFTDSSKQTFKSTYQIIKELHDIWDDLSDVQHAKIEEIVGGKRQLQIIAASISNFKAAEEALDNMANSAGSAESEMDTVRESAEYALNELKETFTSLAQHSVGRGELKNLINAGTSLLEIVDGIVEKIGLIPTILTTIIGITASKKMTKGGLFGLSTNETTGKSALTFLGTEVGADWRKNRFQAKQLKADATAILENKSALQSLLEQKQKGIYIEEQYDKVVNNSNQAVRNLANGIVQGKVSQGELNAQFKNAETAGRSAGLGAKAAAVGVRALNAVVSMGIALLANSILNAIIVGITNAVNSINNLKDKVNELVDKEKSLKSEVENLNEQLVDTKKRISELEAMPALNLVEESELNKLKETNDELERQLRLKRGELANTSYEKNDKAQQLWEEITGVVANKGKEDWQAWVALIPVAREIVNLFRAGNGEHTKWYDFIPIIGTIVEGFQEAGDAFQKNSWNVQVMALEKYKNQLKEINELKKSSDYINGDEKALEDVEKAEEKLKKLADEIQNYYNGTWTTIATGLDPAINKNKEILSQVNAVMKEWDDLNKTVYKGFDDIYNSTQFTETKRHLDELAAKGELTAEKFETFTNKDIKNIEEFKQELKNIDITDFSRVVETIIDLVGKTGDEFEKTLKSAKGFEEILAAIQERLDGFISKQEKLNEAFKKLKLGGTLTKDEIYELVEEIPSLYKYLEETAEGWTITTEGIDKTSEKLAESEKNNIQSKIDILKEHIKVIKDIVALDKQASESDLMYNDPNNIRNSQEYMDLYDKGQEIRKTYGIDDKKGWTVVVSDLEDELEGLDFLMDLVDDKFNVHSESLAGLEERYKEIKDVIDDYNSGIKTVDEAIEKLNEGTHLTYEELNELSDLGFDVTSNYRQYEDGYTVPIDALEEFRKQSYETRNSYIKDVEARVTVELFTAKQLKNTYEKEMEEIKAAGIDATNIDIFRGLEGNLDGVNGQIDYLYGLLKKLAGLRQNIELPGSDKNNENELQEEIDYYKNILEAVGIVRDKYSEAVDSEIDALEDIKDSLQDANDERERELDLIEARNNLENAKKRKVWVYSDDGGFRQVQDEGAVKEAEEKYRDAITEVQIAEIDKEIELREKQKEALEENTKALTELEQNIQDAMTVEQAKASLGLSDASELLNLPVDVQDSITSGLTDAMVKKEAEDNKGNDRYKSLSTEDVLKMMGVTASVDDVKNLLTNVFKDNVYNNTIKSFRDELTSAAREMAASNVVNNNGGTVISPTFNINGVQDPEEISHIVNKNIYELMTKVENSVK